MKENYKYILEKYSGSKSRFVCPNCKKREYTRFINTETREYLSYGFGRCNRIIKCGYFKYPTQGSNLNYENNKVFVEPKIEYLNKEILKTFEFTNSDNSLGLFFEFLFSKIEIDTLFKLYMVRTEKNKYGFLTIFPLIDQDFNLRSLKKMKFNPYDGKRDKKFFQWYNPDKKDLRQCLFGLHLINHPEFKKSKIIIVESEKTTLLGMLYFKNKYLFLATGGLMNLTKEKLKPLENREVILIPDLSPIDAKNSAFDYWKTKSEKFSKEINCLISISNLLEENATEREKNLQLDLGDFIIENLKSNIN